ncbi:MAG: nuclear transport factor 2 family protein [Acidimicrobiia bacterium]|nr:nuclear transport factor 2 family protein [Acidimicrobiia bacterium]
MGSSAITLPRAVAEIIARSRRDPDARPRARPEPTARLAGRHEIGLDAIIRRCRETLDPCDATQHLVRSHVVTLGGRYRDRVTRTPAGWRIAHRELEFVWIAGNPGVPG